MPFEDGFFFFTEKMCIRDRYDEPLSVVLTGDEAPSRGERLFVGLQNARLYNGTERIEPRGELALAESA